MRVGGCFEHLPKIMNEYIPEGANIMTVTIPQPRQTGDLITASMYNELITALEHLLTLQVDGANLALANSNKVLGWNVGDIKIAGRLGDIGTQWFICDGRTIGNAGSGASARANADMQSLFVHLWDNFTNDTLFILDSGGSATIRGVSALADFNAGKRLFLPDLRGRVVAGVDTTNLLIPHGWANDLGGTGGTHSHQLTVSELPMHTHNTGSGVSFVNTVGSGGVAALAAGTSVVTSSTTASTGGGMSHTNLQPMILLSYLIYSGL
jgi:hypothetical protein